eukprot:c6896_g1_i1.p1 GENE.c6896_g1_i1~~c6896_g1_i1.p1  ORF type:complete len:106 (-),score=11.30 c6896_g1_i1:75-392(-)
MPSYHAQASFFFVTYVALSTNYSLMFPVCNRDHILPVPLHCLPPLVELASIVLISFLVCCSRVALHMHSWDQVIVGAIVGLIVGCVCVPVLPAIQKIGLLFHRPF